MVTEKSALSAAPVVTIGMQVIKKIKFNRTKSANVSRNRKTGLSILNLIIVNPPLN